MASLIIDSGATFEMNALDGDIGFALFARPGVLLPQGGQGVLEIDSRRVMFTPTYLDPPDGLYMDGVLEAADVAAIRLARTIRLTVDGQTVAEFPVGAGVTNAMAGMVACSKGRSGWWGPGAPQPIVP